MASLNDSVTEMQHVEEEAHEEEDGNY